MGKRYLMGIKKADHSVIDAAQGNWVDRYAPQPLRPYLRLARADRPIGSWLLFLPCLWSVLLAFDTQHSLSGTENGDFLQLTWFIILFAIGSIAMRGAGCTYNDIIDRKIDAQVSRTRSRPIPSGQVSVRQAVFFLALQCCVGLLVLLQFNWFTVLLGFSSILIVLIYPFMKRITYWPQVVLGAAFAWGALMGWAALQETLSIAPLLLYFGTITWIIGYDTIYAHQDVEDDALLGLKSTALNFGEKTKAWLILFYGLTFSLFLLAGRLAGVGMPFWIIISFAGLHLVWQIKGLNIHNAMDCLKRFKSNRDFGLIITLALIVDILWT